MSDFFEIVPRRFYIGKSINLMLDWLVLSSNPNTQLKNKKHPKKIIDFSKNPIEELKKTEEPNSKPSPFNPNSMDSK